MFGRNVPFSARLSEVSKAAKSLVCSPADKRRSRAGFERGFLTRRTGFSGSAISHSRRAVSITCPIRFRSRSTVLPLTAFKRSSRQKASLGVVSFATLMVAMSSSHSALRRQVSDFQPRFEGVISLRYLRKSSPIVVRSALERSTKTPRSISFSTSRAQRSASLRVRKDFDLSGWPFRRMRARHLVGLRLSICATSQLLACCGVVSRRK